MNEKLVRNTQRLVEWFKQEALPLWSTVGINPDNLGSYERLDASGKPDLDVNLRVRVQARQMFTYSVAHYFGWTDVAPQVVKGLAQFVDNFGRHPSGQGYVHLLNANYEVIDSKQDLYDHAFFLLSLSWRYRAFNDDESKMEAEELVAFLDEKFGQKCGGWSEGDYDAPCRRQNPHMHLFEAFMSWYEASGDASWLARAGEMFALFETRFFDESENVLLEFFNDDWTPLAGDKGRIVEPGHMFEWVWLLRWYQACSGREVSRYADALFQKGLEIGLNQNGLAYDAVTADGKVLDATKRCWPLIELVKAGLVQATAGHEQGEQIAADALERLIDRYLVSSTPGAYIDQLNANDEVSVDVAPASTLYHLIVVAVEAQDYLQQLEMDNE